MAADGPGHVQHVLQVGRAVFAWRRADRDEHDVAVLDGLPEIGGEAEATRGGIARHERREPGLVDRQRAALQALDLGGVAIGADDVVPRLGQARAGHEPDIAGADQRDSHQDRLAITCRVSTISFDARLTSCQSMLA